jgi:hypothetical protein
VTGYRVGLARVARRLEDAEQLQRKRVDWNHRRAASILGKPQGAWDESDKNIVRTLVVSLHDLSEIQREEGSTSCVEGYREALSLAESLQGSQLAAICAFNLGHACEELDGIRDLALAEQWYRRSFDLGAKEDRMGRAGCLVQLGAVVYRRHLDATKTNGPPEECIGHLSNAERHTSKRWRCSPQMLFEN